MYKTKLRNGVWTWAIGKVKYIHEAVRNWEACLVENYSCRFKLPKKADSPFKMGYDPDFDVSPELEPDTVSVYY